MSEKKPFFSPVIEQRVENIRSRETSTLVRADAVEGTAERLLEVTRACNEPGVYEWLFRERLGGEPYPPEDAAQFFEWAHEGWRNGTHFVFLLLSPKGEIVGALDLKSANLKEAEVGYWLSQSHSGVMTNAVLTLAGLARAAGYQKLFARVRPANDRSAAVLRRAGFALSGELEKTFLRFDLDLRGVKTRGLGIATR